MGYCRLIAEELDSFFFFVKLGILRRVRGGVFPMNKNAGFALIELLVVVLIIGILAAVALPQYEKAVEKSRAAEALTLVRAIAGAEDVYYMANGNYATDLRDLDLSFPGVSDTAYSGYSISTQNFDCRGYMTPSDTTGTFKASCRRKPVEGSPYFLAKRLDGRLACGYWTNKGKIVCSAMQVDMAGPGHEVMK